MVGILMTGASGAIGRMLRQRLVDHELRLTDVRADKGVDALDFTDAQAVERACRGVDAVVHLGGIASEGPFEDVLAVNVHGTERVLQRRKWCWHPVPRGRAVPAVRRRPGRPA
jgi:uronate dehydrogenase